MPSINNVRSIASSGPVANANLPSINVTNDGLSDISKSIYDFFSRPAHEQSIESMQMEAQINKYLADYANKFAKDERLEAQAFNQYMAEYANAFSASEAEKARQFTADQADITRAFNKAEAELNRQFQLNMSNTAYQRAVADLKSAGLNPYLAYSQGGAPMASGSSATSTVPGSTSAVGLSASSHGASASKAAASYKSRSDMLGQLLGNIASTAIKVAAF